MKNNYRFFEIHVSLRLFMFMSRDLLIFLKSYTGSYLSKYDLFTYLLLLNITKQAER
jgi:hypothetical protein